MRNSAAESRFFRQSLEEYIRNVRCLKRYARNIRIVSFIAAYREQGERFSKMLENSSLLITATAAVAKFEHVSMKLRSARNND